MNETIIYKSNSFDPWRNLAIEELLLDTVRENQYILYLWQNRDTIVIGKNQNPWKECRAGMLEQDGGYLARRLSGGGTVFHDLGNLNFTFLMNRDHYDLAKQAGIILTAVRNLGIPAEMSGRNDLTVAGRKFSGNAFCFRKNNAYHHGTILVASDFDKMTKYLQVPEDKIRSKGIESVRSRVVNLSEYIPSLKVDTLVDELCYEFTKAYRERHTEYQETVKSIASLDRAVIQELYQKYSSWEWRYGETLQFDLEIATRFPWGGLEIGLKLEKGIIAEAAVYSDAMDEEFIGMLPSLLKGLRLNGLVMANCICGIDLGIAGRQMQADIAQWIMTKKF
jgi:lipoate-protein ligase A